MFRPVTTVRLRRPWAGLPYGGTVAPPAAVVPDRGTAVRGKPPSRVVGGHPPSRVVDGKPPNRVVR